jgi:hypothetical protein
VGGCSRDADGAAQEQQAVRLPSQSFSFLEVVVILVEGITAGAAASWMLLVGGCLEDASSLVDSFVRRGLSALGIAGVVLVLLVPLTW